MQIGDRVKRTDPDTGTNKFFDIKTQSDLDYVKSFQETNFILTVIPVAQDATCVACEG